MSKNDDPGLVIAEEGTQARDGDTRKKIFDSRDFTFRFVDRKEYNNGLVFPPYETANDSFATVLPKTIRHGLGYPPFVKSWFYDKLTAAGDMLGFSSDIGNPRVFSQAQLPLTVMVDSEYIFVTSRNLSQVSGSFESRLATHILIGTENLESPADETIYVS